MSSLIDFLNRIFDICNPRGGGSIHKYLYFKQIALLFLAFFSFILQTNPAAAAFSIEYQAPADPTTQGFSAEVWVPPAPQVLGPIANDLGYPAWSISDLGLSSQFLYLSGSLNATQKADINSQGFTLSLRGRVLQGSAPAFDAGYNTVIGWAFLDTGSKRYDLALGVNSSGNTVAVLLTYGDAYGPGGSTRGYGPTYELNDAGYHTYDLVFNPQTQSASLFIDGVERLSGYTGHTYYLTDAGLSFGASSGGGMNFNLVRLTSPAVTRPHAIAHYTFDETSGTTAHDAVGSVDGTLEGGARFAPGAGIRGGAIMLDRATGDVVNMGDHFGFTSGSFSIETWVKLNPGDIDASVPVGKHWGGIVAGYLLGINDIRDECSAIGRAHFYVAYPCSGVSSIAVNDGQWHQLVGVYNSTNQTASLYVDGQFQSSSAGGNIVHPISAPFLVGGIAFDGTPSSLYTGLIDEVRLYDQALSDTEVNQLYQEMKTAWCGDTLKTSCSYKFSLEKGAQKADSIQLINPGTVPRTATLEVLNPHSDLTVSLPQSTVSIGAGETQTLPITLDASATPAGVYDDLLLKVTADDGSALYASIQVNVVPSGTGPLPDLAITANDIGSVTNADDSVTLTATVRNRGTAPASNVQVRFYEFDNPLGEPVIAQIAPNGIGSASVTVPAMTAGDHLIRVVVDPADAIAELDETNNEASRLISTDSPGPTEGNILVTGSLPATVYTNSLFTLNGRAVYDLYVNGVRYTDYVVKGGSVQITVKEEGGAQWVYGDVYTDVEGNFAKTLQAPATPGTYRITMTVTDKTFVGTRELVFIATEPPPPGPLPPGPLPPLQAPPAEWGTGSFEWDPVASQWVWTWTDLLLTGPVPQQDVFVYSKDIYFSKNNPAADEEITVFAAIRYWASNSALIAENVPVNVYATYPGMPRVKIGQTLLKSLAVGSPDFGARYVYATWKNPGDGIYLIEFAIDPSYLEANLLNNAATRAIIVGQIPDRPQGAISGQVIAPLGGLGNVMIQVFDATTGEQIGNAITDSTGFYLVGNVPADTAVQVRIDTPSGYVPDAEMKPATVAAQTVSAVDFSLAEEVVPSDTTPPTLDLPADITVEATGSTGAVVTYAASATDDVDGEITPTCAPASGNPFPVGATTVTCTATDAAGNGASGSFTVTVVDTTPPALTVPAAITVEATGPTGAVVTYAASAMDEVDGPITPTCAPASGSTFALGNTTVNCSATDAAGNGASGGFTVTVVDTMPPTLTVPGNLITEATGPSGATVTFTTSATDLVDGAIIPTCTSASGSTFALGNTTVNCSAADAAGNTASGDFTVTVVDTTAPDLVCPPDLTVIQGQPIDLGTPTVADVVDANPTLTNDAPASFPLGVTPVTWTATDASGNQATCAQQVTVEARAVCDVDADGDIDQVDLSLISRGRGQVPLPGDPRDANRDGVINAADVKFCIPQCTRPNCATQ